MRDHSHLFCLIGCAIVLFASGCTQEIREEIVRRDQNINSEILKLSDKNLTTENRLEELSDLIIKLKNHSDERFGEIYAKLDELENEISVLEDINNRLDTAKNEISKLNDKTTDKLKVILDEVFKENQRIVKRIRLLEKEIYGEATQQTITQTETPADEGSSYTGYTDDSEYIRHTVKSGENLWVIAQDYGASMESIAEANNMESISDIIKPGETLIIPVSKE